MPEGDTVHRTCRRLHEALAGGVLTRAELRVPSLATRDLVGWTVAEVRPRGKHLLVRLIAPADEDREPLTLHSHLMMEGRWLTDTAAAGGDLGPWRSPAHQARIVLEVEHPSGGRARAVAFEIQQVRLLRTADEGDVVGHLGPDLLDPDWSEDHRDEAVRRLLARPERALGVALLDQTRLAGIGNVYRSELCFLQRVHPAQPVGRFAEAHDLGAMVDLAHRLLLVNAGRTVRVTTGGMMGPRGDLWVYGRAGQRCRRCGSAIRRDHLADLDHPEHEERSIYVCPSCQSEGTPPAPTSRARTGASGRGHGTRSGPGPRGRDRPGRTPR